MARSFNASSDQISVSASYASLADFTLSCWLLTTRSDGQPVIFKLGSAAWQLNDSSLVFKQRYYDGSSSFDDSTVIGTNSWQQCAITRISNTLTFYTDGVAGSSTTATVAQPPLSIIGAYAGGTANQWGGSLCEMAIWNVGLSASEIKGLAAGSKTNRLRPNALIFYMPLWGLTSPEPDLSGNSLNGTLTGTTFATHAPVTLFTPRSITPCDIATGGTNFTLSSGAGTFSVTGKAAVLHATRKLSAAKATFAMTGETAGLHTTRKLAALHATFVVSGQSAGLHTTRKITAAHGAFVVTGEIAGLHSTRKLSATHGTFVVTGSAAGLHTTRKISTSAGSFVVTGKATALNHGHTLHASVGTFTLTGEIAGLHATRKLLATHGTFVVTGETAGLRQGYTIHALAASFIVTGETTSLRTTRKLVASKGSFTLTGRNANLIWSGVPSVIVDYTWVESSRVLLWIEKPRSITWSGKVPNMITQRLGESIVYAYDFSQYAANLFAAGDSLNSGSVISITASVAPQQTGGTLPTLGSSTVVGNKVQLNIQGAALGTFLISFKVQTTGGATLIGDGFFQVVTI